MLRSILSFVVVVAFAGVALGQITGTAHDFSGSGYGSTQICIFCHTPHNADVTVTNSPLWNHEVTAATFTLYTTPTMDATTGQPDGASKLCLSCHDGTVAIDNYGGITTGTDFITGPALVGTDLSNDHPVTFTYDDALAITDGGLHDPLTTISGLGGTIDEDLLFSGSLECASCHDVHDNTINKFLRLSNNLSALCLTCHNK